MAQLKGAENLVIPVKLWIGTKDHLIRKMTYEMDMDKIAQFMPEEYQQSMGSYNKGLKILSEEIHTGIEINPVFADKAFDFIPPEGAQQVTNFSLPAGLPPRSANPW